MLFVKSPRHMRYESVFELPVDSIEFNPNEKYHSSIYEVVHWLNINDMQGTWRKLPCLVP